MTHSGFLKTHKLFAMALLVVANTLCAMVNPPEASIEDEYPLFVVVPGDTATPVSGEVPARLPSADGEEMDDDDTSSRDLSAIHAFQLQIPSSKIHFTVAVGISSGCPEVNTPPPRA